MIELTVLGCSGSIAGPDSAASGYLLRAPWAERERTFSLLLDCGPGSLGALQRHLDPRLVDAVALSHLHPDHCLDLCGFAVAARHAPDAPWPPVDLYGPPGAVTRLARAYDPTPGDSTGPDPGQDPGGELAAVFVEHSWQPSQPVGPFTIRTAAMAHPVPCVAVRIELAGATVVYSGDTGPTPALVELARGADLLLCEAGFDEPAAGEPANPAGVHLSGAEAGRHAAAAGVGRLVITHVPPWFDPAGARAAAQTTFAGPVDLARPDLRLTLP